MKKVEAMSRNIFMEDEKRFDYSKRKATDMKQNTKVHLPGALGIEEESSLEVLRREWLEGYRGFVSEKCNKKKEQVSNLKRSEKEGLKSLRKRVAEGEIVVVPTDKSGRFSVMDIDTYLQADLKHAGKDRLALGAWH